MKIVVVACCIILIGSVAFVEEVQVTCTGTHPWTGTTLIGQCVGNQFQGHFVIGSGQVYGSCTSDRRNFTVNLSDGYTIAGSCVPVKKK